MGSFVKDQTVYVFRRLNKEDNDKMENFMLPKQQFCRIKNDYNVRVYKNIGLLLLHPIRVAVNEQIKLPVERDASYPPIKKNHTKICNYFFFISDGQASVLFRLQCHFLPSHKLSHYTQSFRMQFYD